MPPDLDPDEDELQATMGLLCRQITDEQRQKLEGCAAEILTTLGMDLDTPATRETPRRYIQALFDSTSGYDGDPKLLKAFPTECPGSPGCRVSQIIEGPIRFFALCEHHALPFHGNAYVGYIADTRIIGISKLTRLVRLYANRFAVQERIGRQIADTLVEMLRPYGVAVYLEAHHLCVEMRGVREISPLTRTTFWRGAYEEDPTLRDEFSVACGLQR
jgi:GTP cyclohydrolase IA